MSRLIDKFQKASRVTAAPMGFRTARPAEQPPKMIIIASIAAGGPVGQDYLDGADAALIRFGETAITAKSLQKIISSLPDIPWGLYDEEDEEQKGVEAGADFIVFSTASRVGDIPKDGQASKILEVDSAMDDGLLRAINDLPVDAVLVAVTDEEKGALVWHQLMIFQHLANLLTRPLIVPVPADISEQELKILWEAGVDGITVRADAEQPEALPNLRKAIDKLPLRAGRKRGRVNVILPHTGVEAAQAAPPDEEEEEDE
jgi:hypothetical protein